MKLLILLICLSYHGITFVSTSPRRLEDRYSGLKDRLHGFLFPGGVFDRAITTSELVTKMLKYWDADNTDCLSQSEWSQMISDVGFTQQSDTVNFPNDFDYVDDFWFDAYNSVNPDYRPEFIKDDCLNRAELEQWNFLQTVTKTFPVLEDYPVRISTVNGQPEVYYSGSWYPICGHWFWDTGYGPNLFCTALKGVPSTGTITQRMRYDYSKRQVLSSQGIMIGKCLASDTSIFGCTGGYNMVRHFRGRCAAGQKSGIIIACS